MKSSFNQDINIENEVNKYLDTYIYPELSKEFGLIFTRNYDNELQNKGVDTVGIHKLFNQTINIDEKTATHYFQNNLSNTGLKTFALELEYHGRNNAHKEGWLFNSKYSETDAYLFSWGWTSPEIDDWKNIKYENIKKIESVLVLKKDLLKHLDYSYNFNKAFYTDYINQAKNTNNQSKFYIKENGGPYILKSSKNSYYEAPTNLIFPKEDLIKISKKHIIHNKN
ncbi:hypothetical protein GTN31_08550 [Macrococcoides canis]|uniref:hypothetical protein n=1 Tax=Macrococcoides canis TaxID=1855823 RepID=UPI0013E94D54|nr:hypothetical protein [Macrococcus canis]QIH76412.1 hypothetical protein GTN31_08550 [Macrococcus canis]